MYSVYSFVFTDSHCFATNPKLSSSVILYSAYNKQLRDVFMQLSASIKSWSIARFRADVMFRREPRFYGCSIEVYRGACVNLWKPCEPSMEVVGRLVAAQNILYTIQCELSFGNAAGHSTHWTAQIRHILQEPCTREKKWVLSSCTKV